MKDTWEKWEEYKAKVEGHHLAGLNAATYT